MLAMEAVRKGWCASAGSSGEGARGAGLGGALLRAGDIGTPPPRCLLTLLTLLMLLLTRLMLVPLSLPTPPAVLATRPTPPAFAVLASLRIPSLLSAPLLRRACWSASLFSVGGEWAEWPAPLLSGSSPLPPAVERRLGVSRDGAPISSGTSGPFRFPLPFTEDAVRLAI